MLIMQKGGVNCPTCRQHADVRDITVVGPKQALSNGKSEVSSSLDEEEAAIVVQGSYGTKVTLPF